MKNDKQDAKEVGYNTDYRERIIEMVGKINNQELLIKIYTFIKTWLE